GETYASLNNNNLAAEYYYRSIPFALAIKDNEVLSSDYYGLAKIFKVRNMLDSAIYYARTALFLSREAPFLKQVVETSTFLSNLFKTKKQFDSALHYQELSIATKDSLFNVENVKKVQNLKFREQQRQQAIKTANIEYRNKIKLYIVFFASGVFLFIAVVLWRSNKQKQKAYALVQQQKSKTEQAYEELKATQAQLIQSEKMASLGELTAGISHEIQNPLNFVNNFSDVSKELLEEMRTDLSTGNYHEAIIIADDVKRNLEKILHHGKRADAIVKGMLQHSRANSGDKEPTNINALADEYLRLSYQGLRAKDKSFNATLQTDFDETIEKINIIQQDIGRVLLNLYNNAFYAVSEKQKSAGSDYEPKVEVSTKAINPPLGGLGVLISVRDNGNGIPREVVDKIFQPFFTTKPTGQGTGLGLSLAYDIIKAHGGEIKVQTTDGEGSEFIIILLIK
ncbi:MAG: ATP-binding protein, partial [Parafilimonas sp.]